MEITLADKSSLVATTTLVSFETVNVMLTFVVVDQLSTPLMLGMYFLETMNPTIDWRSKCVSWSTPTGSLTLNGSLWSNSGAV